jgi:phage N-6-adenine-methyltransferase
MRAATEVPAAIQPADAALAQLVQLDLRVNGAEHDGIMARWEFGRALLKEREANGGKQLPHGRLAEVSKATGKDESEVRRRVEFAAKYGTRQKVVQIYTTYPSWWQICTDALPAENHRAKGTGENEWYTPAKYLDLARQVLGQFDLDPASSDAAQERVQAAEYFTAEDDGLAQEWRGRVWLNPPYAQPLIQQFAEKMAAEVSTGRVVEAVMLTHNYTDTEWFHTLESVSAAICFTRGRIAFESTQGVAAPTQGQAFFYFGSGVEHFRSVFASVGFVR